MANTSYRTCLVCKTRYRYCGHCAEYESWPTWYTLFHGENCHDIWYTLSDFESGFLTKEEAQEKISHLDTSVIKNEDALRSLAKLNGTEAIAKDAQPEEKVETVPDKPLSVSEELKKHESKGHM